MTGNNFNWFLHVLLFLHTEHVIRRQKEKKDKEEENEDEDEDEDLGIDIDRE